jgi:predicted dehydrogenase
MIRVAIVGCGSVSRHYLSDLKTCEYAQVVALCDVVEERARERAEQFGIPRIFTDLDEMLSQCEFEMLINLTPMQQHYPVNLKALQAGKHVLSEKPFRHYSG